MQQIITAKLKLKTKLGEHRLLRQTQLAYRDALNYVMNPGIECRGLEQGSLCFKPGT